MSGGTERPDCSECGDLRVSRELRYDQKGVLRRALRQRGHSVTQIAARAGVSRPLASRVINGGLPITTEARARVAHELGVYCEHCASRARGARAHRPTVVDRRQELGLSVEEVAEAAGVNVVVLEMYEAGQDPGLTQQALNRLLAVLEIEGGEGEL